MTRTFVRRRNSSIFVESLESRYVLDSTLGLSLPILGSVQLDLLRSTWHITIAARPADSPRLPGNGRRTAVREDQLVGGNSSAVFVQTGDRHPGRIRSVPNPAARPASIQIQPLIFIHYEMVLTSSGNSSAGSTDNDSAYPSASAPPAASLPGTGSRGTGSSNSGTGSTDANTPPTTQPHETPATNPSNATHTETTTPPPANSRPEAIAAVATTTATRADGLASALAVNDRRVDRTTAPTAFATSLSTDAVRATESRIDPNRPLPSPADLGLPLPTEPSGEVRVDADSTPAIQPVAQARDAVFANLFIDGFAPQLLDQAFRVLKSVEANFEAPDGAGWYRVALGCWVVAAAMAFEAARQTQTKNARSLRYAATSLREPEDER